MVQFKHGDIFAIELSEKEYAFGRILLNIKKQCIDTRLIDTEAQLNFYEDAILIDIYKQTASDATFAGGEVLLNGLFVISSMVANGSWPIIDHISIDPKSVEFPENLAVYSGSQSKFIKGEIELIIDMEQSEMDDIEVYPSTIPPIVLSDIILYYLSRHEEIDSEGIDDLDVFSLNRYDLRYNPSRIKVYDMLNEDMNQTYYDMAVKKGLDLSRFY